MGDDRAQRLGPLDTCPIVVGVGVGFGVDRRQAAEVPAVVSQVLFPLLADQQQGVAGP